MRKQGKVTGHEVRAGKSISGSTKGSQVDSKEEKKENDFDDIELPLHRFIKEQPPSADTFGFVAPNKQEIVEPEFKTPINRPKIPK